MSLNLVFPCNEDTNKMTDTENGKFCGQCNKEVIDFTEWDKDDIVEYLSTRKSCGIFKNNQLDKIESKPIVHIRPRLSIVKKAVASLTVLLFTLVGCDDAISQNHKVGEIKPPKVNPKPPKCNTTVGASVARKIEPVKLKGKVKRTVGDTIAEPIINSGIIEGEARPEFLGDVIVPMAQFPEGEEALMKFLSNNLRYPKYEATKNIEGIVYVEFAVMADGSIKEIKIKKSVEGSKNFDQEVIRVIKKMPKWDNPSGTKSYQTLPISFNLD